MTEKEKMAVKQLRFQIAAKVLSAGAAGETAPGLPRPEATRARSLDTTADPPARPRTD